MGRDITSLPAATADERISYGDAADQFFDVSRPPGSTTLGTVVMIHGGFWRERYDLSHASHLCAALAKRGIATANLEYRRVGQSGGGWPATFEDVITGIKAADGYLGSSPVVLGHSAGGHLALRAACEQLPLRGVVALAPVAVLRTAYELNLSDGAVAELLGGTPASRPDAYAAACPANFAATVPRVLIHGNRDDVVPISISRAFARARAADPIAPKLIEIDADHMELIDPESKAWPVVLETVVQLLSAPDPD